MGYAFNDFACRPRRMQEKADRLCDTQFAQFSAERQEVIVLDPERGVRLPEAQQCTRHERVYLAIREIIRLRGANEIGAGMQCRPKGRIGETFVISAVMRRGQIEHRQRAGSERLDFGKWFLLSSLADTAAGTDPNRARIFYHRQQRRSQTARNGPVVVAARDTI